MMVSALPLDWSLAASRKVYVPSASGGRALRSDPGRGSRRGLRCGLRGLGGLFGGQAIGAVEYHDDGGQDHQDAICQLPARRRGETRFFLRMRRRWATERRPLFSGVIMSTSNH